MFEAKDVIGDAVKRTVKLFTASKRGDVIAWKAIFAAAGFDRESSHWTAFNKRFRRDFHNATSIEVWPVNGVGLKLCTIDFQLNQLPLLRGRRALRQQTRALKAVKVLPDGQLTTHQRVTKSHQLEKLRKARKDALNSVRIGHKLLKPSSSGLPRGKVEKKSA